jgi:hypothetical protein
MKSLAFVSVALALPVLGLLYSGRMLWSAVLAFLAGMGLACSKSGDTPDNAKPVAKADNPLPPVVTCYQQANPVPVFTDAKWQGDRDLEQWAIAERSVLAMIGEYRINYYDLEPPIKRAEEAYARAQSAVGKGLLSAETYQLAGQFFADWHQTIATAHSTITCYESRPVTPMIADVNKQLTQLNDLRRAGKLNKVAVEQATVAIKQRVGKETSPAVAEELSRLLIQILEF